MRRVLEHRQLNNRVLGEEHRVGRRSDVEEAGTLRGRERTCRDRGHDLAVGEPVCTQLHCLRRDIRRRSHQVRAGEDMDTCLDRQRKEPGRPLQPLTEKSPATRGLAE